MPEILIPQEIVLALIALVSGSVGVLVWVIKALMNYNREFKDALLNHFTDETKVLLSITDNLVKINTALEIWNERWESTEKWGRK